MDLDKKIRISTDGLKVRWLGESDDLGFLNGRVYDVEAIRIDYNAEEKHGLPSFAMWDEDDIATDDGASLFDIDCNDFEIAEGADVYAAAEREAEKRLGFKVPFPEFKKA